MSDPYYSSVSLLLHCNGSDGSTTFTDDSPNPKTVTALSDAQIDTAQSKWGGASGSLETAGDTLTVATDADFGFESGAFTVEAWIRPTEATTDAIFDFRTTSSGDGIFYLSSTSKLTYTNGTVYGNTGSAVSTGVWSHVRWDYDGTTMRAYLDGVEQWSATFATSFASSCPVTIGANYTTTGSKFLGHIDDIRITKGIARGAELPTGEFDEADTTGQIAEDDGPLQQPTVLGIGPLVEGRVSDAGPLGAELVFGLHDFTAVVSDAISYYVMDLETPGGLVRVPISSWQATLQVDEESYVQCVVPACAEWVEDLGEATEFVISRQVTYDGATIEYEMARAPLQTLSMAQGPTNYSATLSGYTAALTADDDPPAVYDRDLTGLRSIFTTGANVRARTAIDWLLRPGHRAWAGDTEIIVDFISYYVGQGDAYMDVGERA